MSQDFAQEEGSGIRDPEELEAEGHRRLEIYRDRPRERWEGKVAERMTTLPLDVDDLLGVLPGPPPEGFGLMAELGSQAAFLGATVAAAPAVPDPSGNLVALEVAAEAPA